MMKHNLGSPSLPSEPAGRTPEQTNNLNDERQRGLSLDGARRSGLSMNCSPQSGLSLNDARRSGLSRLGLSCLSLLLVAALLTVGVTASKYTSEATVTIPPLTAAAFKNNVEFLDNATIESNRDNYNLKDTDVLVSAFKVTNYEDDITSEVDLSVDVALELEGTYTYTMTITIPSNPLLQNTIIATDSVGNDTQAVFRNATFCQGLKSYLVIGTMADGKFTEIKRLVNTSASSAPEPASALDTTKDVPGEASIKLGSAWTDCYTFKATEKQELTCLIIIDTYVLDEFGSQITYTGPNLELKDTRAYTDGNNLTVTVNQAKSGGEG